MRVLNQMGPEATAAIRSAVPGVEVVEVPFDRVEPGVRGEILFGAWHASPVFAQLDELGVRWVHIAATGVDGYDPVLYANERIVTASRGASAIPISEFVLAAILSFEKRLPATWVEEPPEHWNFASLGELSGKVLGLVGLGGIGAAVAERALPFGMRVVAVRRTGRASPIAGVELTAELAPVLEQADHLVLAAPATHRTRALLNAESLGGVKPGVHVVNVARGDLVDQDALRAALDDGRVACATLDVVTPEPLPAGHWMYGHPRVRLSPHVSWSSPRLLERITAIFVAELRRYVAGEPLEFVVDPDEGY